MAARTPFPRAITTPCMLPPHNQRRQKENRFDSGAIDRGPHLKLNDKYHLPCRMQNDRSRPNADIAERNASIDEKAARR
ncbi:uncharacterized protein PHALS_06587 [Plasmopara halstedii]|uniref:Uncharacterized protein n=1 Tax=Plasmopara halstedii TaxID=4781 RepID=A0A0P1B4E5_PLAHL|nr:uncharacterized protein PHALS_06587 [Plasmopara halstedii]CEG48785.1 hypothetical protein PHALS_06587 [Plasmopara halstedii]|eukprot:XP_024585154.1 hypothetical protein PHALS_06587 [Plasmopara halstedii]